MSYQSISVLVLTVDHATEAVADRQLVGFDGGPTGADEHVLGMANMPAAVGETFAVTAMGVVELVAGDAIAAGDKVYSDADGKPTAVGADNPFGRAITGGGAGDLVEIIIT